MSTIAQEDAASRVRSWLFDVEDRMNRLALVLRERPDQVENAEFLNLVVLLGHELAGLPAGSDISEVVHYASQKAGDI